MTSQVSCVNRYKVFCWCVGSAGCVLNFTPYNYKTWSFLGVRFFLERHIFTVEWWLLEKKLLVYYDPVLRVLLVILFGIIFSSDPYSC